MARSGSSVAAWETVPLASGKTELMCALREASGPGMHVMIDAWANWGVPYTLRMAKLLRDYEPA